MAAQFNNCQKINIHKKNHYDFFVTRNIISAVQPIQMNISITQITVYKTVLHVIVQHVTVHCAKDTLLTHYIDKHRTQ